MSIIRYNDVVIGVNGWGANISGLSAINASINFSNPQTPIYAIGKKSAVTTTPNGPVRGTASISYYLTGTDQIYGAFNYAATGGDLTTPMTMGWGNVVLTGCYLNNYSAAAAANQVAQATVEFGVYMTQGGGVPITAGTAGATTGQKNIGHGANTPITYDGVAISDALSFNIQCANQFEETYILGASTPIFPLVLSSSQKTLTLEGYNLTKAVTMCGTAATGIVTLKDLCSSTTIETFAVTGKIESSDLSVSAGGAVQGSITIVQHTY